MLMHFKTDHQRRIESFMKRAGQEVKKSPEVPDIKVRQLRAALILEECLETVDALGFTVETNHEVGIDGRLLKWELEAKEDQDNIDLIEIVDGCADISVVTIGTLSACGVSDAPILHEVDDNNLAKFGHGSYIRDDGKLVKPDDHKPPRIAEALQRLIEESSHERETSSQQDNEISGESGSESGEVSRE